jgi:hypothetical protein
VGNSSFLGDNQPALSSSRRRAPALSSVVGSTGLSPIRPRRLTRSGSSLSWQRSLRPPPASLGDRVYRRELHSASGAPPSGNAPRSTGVPSGRCCRLLRDRGDEQGRSPVDDRSRLGFRHSVVGVAAGRQYRPGDEPALSAARPGTGCARPALSGSTRRLVVVAKGGGSHQSATR